MTTIMFRTSQAMETCLQKCFARFGRFVGERPKLSVGLSVLFAMLCLSGVSQFVEEDRPDKLWIPQDTQAMEDRDKYEIYFPTLVRVEDVIVTSKSSANTNVLEKNNLIEVLTMWTSIEGVNYTYEGEKWWLTTKLCLPQDGEGSPCMIKSVLGAWDYDLATLQADGSYMATLNTFLDASSSNRWLGNLVTDANGDVVSAEAIEVYFLLQDNDDPNDRYWSDPVGEGWEAEFLSIARSTYDLNNVFPFAERSWSDEFEAAITNDLSLVFVSYMIMMFYLSTMLGSLPCANCVDSRIAIALVALLTVALAVGSSIGLSSLFGYFYTGLHSALPFVLLGLGVDDSFVLMEAFRRTDLGDDSVRRSAESMRHAGVSILITSLTDFVAFFISSTSAFPALESFCVYAAIGILLLFLFQISIFAPALVMDERSRRMKRYRDVICCVNARKSSDRDVVGRNHTKNDDAKDEEEGKGASNRTKRPRRTLAPNCLVSCMNDVYSTRLAHASVWTHACIVLAIGGIAAASVYGATELKVESNFRKFVPSGSYVHDFFDAYDTYFYENPVPFYVVLEDLDYSDTSNQQAILDIGTNLDACCSEYVVPASSPYYESWYVAYYNWLQSASGVTLDADGFPTTEALFYQYLNTFLATTEGEYYVSDIIFTSTSGAAYQTIEQSRISYAFISATDSDGNKDYEQEVASMKAVRNECNSWSIPAYPYTFLFLEWEMLDIIKDELVRNVMLCLLAVLIITTLLIAHPTTSFLVFLCVTMTLVDVLGFMYFWGLAIDNVTVINTNLAVGLSVDYSAHIGHHFMATTGTRRERVRKALAEMGGPVFNGACSTFLAVSLLGLSQSYVFQAMFKQFFLTVIFGVMHGLIFLPVALLYVGPRSALEGYENEGDESQKATAAHPKHMSKLTEIAPVARN